MANPPNPPQRGALKSLGMAALGLISAAYLANPGAGIFDLLPDVIPGIGNIDEALASLLLLRVLAYFGINLVGAGRKPDAASGPVIDIDGPGRPKQ